MVPQVDMHLNKIKELQKDLASLLLEKAEFKFLPYFLAFSYLGARVCYSAKHPLLLFEEEKFKNQEKFKEFLLRLKKAGHHSVFAHTPVFLNIRDLTIKEKFSLASVFFKVFWDEEKKVALFNLRHFSEVLSEEKFSEILDVNLELSSLKLIIYRNWKKVFEGFFNELKFNKLNAQENIFAIPEVIILEVKKEAPFKWIGVIVKGFSRIFSHQFVRHTWLNFNQRSHRYTFVDSFVLPEAFTEELKELYLKQIKTSMEIYKKFIDKVHRESLRFILPQGASTTLLATGPMLVWEDFVSKRAIPQAQGEIRRLAFILKDELGL